MPAIYLTRYGNASKAFELRETPACELHPGMVRISVAASGLNFADVMARKGMYKPAPKPPCVLGYDVAGTISAVGDGVSADWVGKRVVALTRFGGYASEVCTSEQGVAEIPDSLDFVDALTLGTQYVTAYLATHFCSACLPRDWAIVQAAAGGVGQALVRILKNKECRVIGVVGRENKIEVAMHAGCDHVVLRDHMDDMLDAIPDFRKADIIFNAIGGKSFKADMKRLGVGGRMVAYGATERLRQPKGLLGLMPLLLNFGWMSPAGMIVASKSVSGLNLLALSGRHPILVKEALNAVVKGTREGWWAPKAGHIFPAADVAEAHALMESGRSTGKIALIWD